LGLLSSYSSFLPLVVLLFFNREKMTTPLKVILFYTILSFTNDALLRMMYDKNNDFLVEISLRVFTVFEYLLFATFLYLVIKSSLFKKLIIGLSLVFLIVTFYNYNKSPNSSFDSVPVSIESILLIIYCLYYFFERMNEPQVTFIYSAYHFWVVIGILIYLSASFFLFMQADNLSQTDKKSFWIIAVLSNSLKNIFFTIAFVIKKTRTKSSGKEKTYTIS
jgi:hypothetical protein